MNEQRRNQRKDVKWQPISSELNCLLSIVSFHDLKRIDHLTRIIDRSIIGIGIETDHSIPPGVVWFKESVYGSQCGILMWCHQTGTLYRCGIRFISLTQTEEDFLRYQVQQTEHRAQIRDPDRIIARLNDCLLKD